MRALVVGDLHFGIKSNSLSWLESQLKFFKDQIFVTIEEKNIDRIIFLGDISDIRYSVNQQIGIELKKLFREMLNKFNDKEFIIVAGNHDYYSPLEEFAEYTAYELMFGEEFYKCHPNLRIIQNEPYMDDDGNLFLPWYWTENPTHFDEILYNYDFSREVKAIYCHADLMTWPGARIGSLKGCPVYSGHIHNINIDTLSNLYNLGAAVALTFNDVNEDRYLYIIEDHKIVDRIKNVTTPRFIRIYDEAIFTASEDTFNNSYVQLCISSTNVNKAKYVEQIKYLKTTYVDANIRVHIIDGDTDINTLNVEGLNTNIQSYIEKNIPEHLDDKYELITNRLKQS